MRSVWCLVGLTLLVAVAHGQDDRLPGESRPSSQRVDVTVYQDDEGERSFTFEGQTSVTAQVVRDTAQLVLHAAVSVSSLTVRYQGGDVIASSYEQPQDGRDFLVVSLQEQEAEGSLLVLDIIFSANIGNREPGFSRYDYQGRNEQATAPIDARQLIAFPVLDLHSYVAEFVVAEGSLLVLDIGFSGNIGNREPGFSRYDYQGRVGQEAVYATQFMPNYARRALPCYDEPALKARYQLNMRLRPKTYRGYRSNARSIYDDELDAQGFRGYYLEQTPPISAYQLSWVLHDVVGRVSSGDVSTVVWQVTSRSDQNGFASYMGPPSVEAMEQLLGVPLSYYDINKMDHMAVPGYIEESMSGLGIITLHYTSEATKERVLGVIQRKAAHQWFGGLLSPSWWNDLWLTEGFASYFQWIAAALVQPSWQLREAFVVNAVLQAAMPADGAPGSYPLSKSPNVSAQQAFDEYFYEKGASIVWMMENITGSEPFYRALNKYLTQKVGPDLKRVVYCYGAQQGGENAYNFLMDLYQTTDIVSELNDIVLGVTCSQFVDGLRLLELTATGAKGGFRREHLQWLLEGLLQRRHTLPSALQFLSGGTNLLSRPDERQAARKLLRLATLEMRNEQMLDKVQQAAVALEDESLVTVAQWRRDVIANGAAARRDAARWLKGKPWRL
ncbi:puromycin-sensitive aminopeptidase-like protein [Schistocerca gregaria]|uniref:puromycin-sensitive aminopeptidase-like protein n=1 Tax=Schistocerca gregaria TaxID=7010 RepID=UPI00211F2B07|nr:puromycin-sensitive aminopeptidase-like protein [Schistocerca gregaria]